MGANFQRVIHAHSVPDKHQTVRGVGIEVWFAQSKLDGGDASASRAVPGLGVLGLELGNPKTALRNPQ